MKTQLIICTHGRFGEELLRSAEMIAGPMKDIKVFRCCREWILLTYAVRWNLI